MSAIYGSNTRPAGWQRFLRAIGSSLGDCRAGRRYPSCSTPLVVGGPLMSKLAHRSLYREDAVRKENVYLVVRYRREDA